MCGIAVDFNIEYMASASEFVVGAFYFSFVAWRAFVIDGHMIRVGVVYLVGYAGNLTKGFTVFSREFP